MIFLFNKKLSSKYSFENKNSKSSEKKTLRNKNILAQRLS